VTLTAGAFSRNFLVNDPAGAGSTVAIDFTGFEVTTSTMNVLVQATSNWVMLSEVQFSAIPEPSTWALLIGAVALAAATLRHRRR
jgi:hypothetical protein